MKNLPVVAIVGRPNVGKSALFNRITGKQIALVFDRPGVTRDRIAHECKWNSKPFLLIDTGGIGLDDESGFEVAIQREVQIAVETATDILLVVDGRAGVHALDADVAKRLRKTQRRIHLVVNKMDSGKQEDLLDEFRKLGFDSIWPISAAHGHGVQALLAEVTKKFEEAGETSAEDQQNKTKPVNVAVVGRPNVGKSSLINAILEEDRLIVSPVSGTTRDAVDVSFEHQGVHYCFVDTAGMRKRSKVHDPLEQVMTGRTAHSINRADICTLVIDAVEGLGEQEKKIAGLIQQSQKPCIVLVNKWDLVSQVDMEKYPNREAFQKAYEEALRRQLFFIPYALIAFVSAQESRGLGRWLKALSIVAKERQTKIGTGQLNRVLQKAQEKQNPPRKGGKLFKIYYATQVPEPKPIPTLTVFVNDSKLLTEGYLRYLEQQVRAEYPCTGCPIIWEWRSKQKPQKKRR